MIRGNAFDGAIGFVFGLYPPQPGANRRKFVMITLALCGVPGNSR